MRDNFWKRLAAIVLCAAMMMSTAADVVEAAGLIPVSGTGSGDTASSPTEVTQGVSKREADPSTMDSFKDILDFASDSRNAGRIWADKSVFAYGDAQEDANFYDNILHLDADTDGSTESIKLDADFLHVYSLLGSSQEFIGVPPVRTVIVFDNSGSMYDSYKGTEKDLFDRQRIAMTVEAINRAIDALMISGRYNEVSVVLFGDGANDNVPANGTVCYHGNNTAVTILPMKHYTPDDEVIKAYNDNGSAGDLYTKYLAAGWKNGSEKPDGSNPNQTKKDSSGWVFVDNVKCRLTKSLSDTNDAWKETGYNGCGDSHYTAISNGTTNIQAGYYVGMQELLKADKTVTVGTQTYKCVPSLIMLTDGQTTDMLDGTYITPAVGSNNYPKSRGFVNDTGNKLRSFVGVKKDPDNTETEPNKVKEIPNFWDMFVRYDKTTEKYYSAAWTSGVTFSKTNSPYDYKDSTENHEAFENMEQVAQTYSDSVASMVLGTLMTTAYYKEAVRKAFDMGEDNWKIYTVSVDMTDMSTIETGAVQKALEADDNELPKSWAYNINSNSVTMDPSEYFKLNEDNVADLSWLKDKGYIDSDVADDNLTKPDEVIEHTGYPDYSVGEMLIHGMVKAANYLKSWANGDDDVTTSYEPWNSSKGILTHKGDAPTGEKWDTSKYTNPWTHTDGYLLEGEQTITWPQVPTDAATNPYGVTKADVLKNIDYNEFAYYPSTAKGSAAELTNVFVDIVNDIMEPLFEPVGGMNDLGGQDAITYMDPVGKYMDVKDVKNVLLFGDLYGIVKTAVYDYRFNDAYVKAHQSEGLTPGTSPFPEGWYKGDNGAEAEYAGENAFPTGCDDANDAWDNGWVYRINTVTASQFVPNIANVDKPDEANEKLRATKYTFYRFDLTDEERNKLRMNPAYGDGKLTEKDDNGDETDTAFGRVVKEWEAEHAKLTAEKGVSTYPVENDIYSSLPGVYRLSDIRIWVEDTGSYSAIVDGDTGVESDDNFDEAIWINVPTSALPLRTVTINLAHTSDTGSTDATATYSTNVSANYGKDALPLRVFYTVGVSDAVRNEAKYINIASEIGPNYLDRYKITTQDQVDDRGIGIGNVEFFSNWYNSERKYSDYTSVDTEYSFGDPVMTFSPALSNRYYVFQAPTPLYLAPIKDYTSTELGSQIKIESSALGDNGVTVNGEECSYVTTAKQISADNYYYILTDYYEFGEKNVANPKLVAELRKGTEFGGGFGDGNYTLCWYNVNNTKKIETKPFTTGSDIPEAAEGQKWVLAAATGGIRTGDSHRDRTLKLEKDDHIEYIPIEEDSESGEGSETRYTSYLIKNRTRTANTVLLPTVSSTTVNSAANTANGVPAPAAVSEGDSADGSESKDSTKIRLDMYLGNNGRLAVMDSVLLLTKEVDMGPLSDTEAAPNSEEEFEFEVELKSDKYQSGSFDAVRVVKNSAGQWQRIIDYIDLELDAKMFLQNEKGDPVTVNENGEVVENGQYYVYVGANQDNGGHESLGNDERNFRIFHTSYHEGFNRVGEDDVKVEFEYACEGKDPIYRFEDPEKTPPTIKEDNVTYTRTGKRKFYLTHVWLFTKEQYDAYEVETDGEGNIIDPTSGKYTKELSYGESDCNGFFIMDYDPNSEESTEVKLTTDYLYNSAYLSQTVEFKDRKATVMLHSDEGLLFNSIPSNTSYTITETLTDEQIAKGYDFKEVEHVTSDGSSTTYDKASFGDSTSYSVAGKTSGYESAAHYINTWTTNKSETSINGKDDVTPEKDPDTGLYPSAQVEDTITYHIKWANNTDDPAVITVTDKLDPGVDFVSAGMVKSYAEGKDYPVYTNDRITSEDNYTNGNIDGKLGYTIKYDPATHTVQWLIGRSESDLNLGGSFGAAAITPVPQGAFGEVELTVRVNDKAHELWSYADDDPTKEGTGDRSEDDFLVHNKAKILVGDNSYNTDLVTNPVEGPDKDETEINDGDGTSKHIITDSDGEYSEDGTWTGPAVNVGDKITYEITFVNAEKDSALITITDELDPNVSYVEGTDGMLTVTYTKFKEDGTIEDENAKLSVPVKLSYNTESHTVTWVIGTKATAESGTDAVLVPATGYGKVSLTVEVKEGAVDSVKNEAQVQVGNKTIVDTKTVENHILEPEKTETDPGDGKLVGVGEDITYEIKWENANPKAAAVVITDPLDDGVDFVSASIGDSKSVNDIFIDSSNHKTTKTVTIDGHDVDVTIEYKDDGNGNKLVIWTFGEIDTDGNTITGVPAGASGTVTLKVKVNERAVNKWTYSESANSGAPVAGSDYEVLNRAEVKVDNKATFTATVENPVPEKTETAINGDPVTEDGTSVHIGDTVTYKIAWKNGNAEEAIVEITDPLDIGVDFVSASAGSANMEAPNAPETTATATGTVEIGSEKVNVKISLNGKTVTWTIGDDTTKVPAGASGEVVLTVKVNDKAFNKWTYDSTENNGTETTGEKDNEIVNRAQVKIGDKASFTTEVENPVNEKTEPDPGDGKQVAVGDEITYEINWKNGNDHPAAVVITDPLDMGVDFESASFGDVVLNSSDTKASGTITIDGNPNIDVSIEYDSTNKVVKWTIGTVNNDGNTVTGVPAGASGTVTLKVKVNERAVNKWTYSESANSGAPAAGSDYEVLNRAEVKVDNKATFTATVENPVPEKTETAINGEGVTEDGTSVHIGDTVTYKIAWKNGNAEEAIVEITDPLDIGVDFVSAAAGDVTLDTLNEEKSGNITIDGYPDPVAVMVKYDSEKKEAVWTIGTTIKGVPAGASGEVTLIVKVNKNAFTTWTYDDVENKGVTGSGNDNEIVNRAQVKIGDKASFTTEVENPVNEKTEPDPGDGKQVAVGDEITYEINWKNGNDHPAAVVITDPLDIGVDYVSAAFTIGTEGKVEYNDKTHTVTWTIEKAPAGASGAVTLVVKVNKDAVKKWNYKDNHSGKSEEGNDYEVVNRAEVSVDNKPTLTTEVENPVPEKTETKIDGDAVTEAGTYDAENHTWTFAEVEVGQTITYSIHYKNSHDTPADVEIVDKLDNGVDFVNASVPVISSMVPRAPTPTSTYSYNKSEHTVTWTLKNVPAYSEGDVTLTVRVNHNATPVEEGENPEGQVKNSATVQVGDDLKTTEKVVNPTPHGSFEVTKIVAESVTADDNDEFTFTVKFEPKDNGTLCFSYNEADKTYTMIVDKEPDDDGDEGGGDSEGDEGESKVVVVSGNEITFKLKENETMKFSGLPVGTPYTVTEVSDNVSGKYTTEWSYNAEETGNGSQFEGTIVEDVEGKINGIVFKNTRRKADITLTKKVEKGLPSDNTADFTFTIELMYKDVLYTGQINIEITKGEEVSREDGKYTVTLKDGGSVKLSDIPTGALFRITEIMPDGSAGNFDTEFDVKVGTETLTHDADGWYKIDDSAAAVLVACTNTRKTGELRIDKTVFGDYATKGDRDKEFEFKLKLFEGETQLNDADYEISAKRYTIGSDTYEPVTCEIVSGGEYEGWYSFKLKHNQYIVFEGIPVGAEYTVIEDPEGKYLIYTGTSAEDAAPNDNAQESGKIVEGTNSEHFFNRPKRLPEKTETDPGAGKVVGTGKHITYNIKWSNDYTKPAVVVITDRLDNGVDFVKASLYGVALESGNGKDVSVTGTASAAYGGGTVTIAYDSKSHTVIWTIDEALAGASDSAVLEVAVNENADLVWNYDEPEGGIGSDNDESEGGIGSDYKVFNRAQVKVGNDSTYTSTVENPVVDISIEKWQSADHADPTTKDQEMTKGRFQVYENDTVTYYLHVTVTGSNGSKLTGVTVYDFVPEELTYVENSGKYGATADTLAKIGPEGGVTYSYDASNRKIEWIIGDVEIGEGGKTDFWVSFDVKVPYKDWREWKNTGTVSSNELPDKQSKEVEIYEQYGALRLTKVASEGVPENREFKFKFQFFDKDGNEITNYSYPYVIEEDVTSTVAANARISKSPIGAFNVTVNPIASYTLTPDAVIRIRNGQTLKFEKLPVGATFEITEIDAAGFDISIDTSSENVADGTNTPFVEYEHKPDANGNVEGSNVMTGTVEFNADTEILNVRYANICKPSKTETDHEVVDGSNNNHVVYENVKVGDIISYKIDWYNGTEDGTVTVTDRFDANTEFVSASYGDVKLTADEARKGENGYENGGSNVTIAYDGQSTVTWTISNVKALASGYVELKVKVKESAVDSGKGKVENTADVQIDNRAVQHTETVENDVHTGNLRITKAVSGGQQDLETGYNFTLSLTFGEQPLDGTYNYTITPPSEYRKDEEATTGKIGNGGEFTLYNGETISISNLPEGTEYSITENVDANKFDVYVDGKLNGEIKGTITSDKTVKSSFAVANVRKPSKDETAINGTTTPVEQTDESRTNVRVYNDVKVGDVISYRIDWHNGPDDNATIKVIDDLDPNVEFVSASYGECVLSAGSSTVTEDSATITYDDHTVTWTIQNVDALASGSVELKVKVKEGAVVSEKVDNKAEVRIGDNYKQETDTVENNVNKGNLIVTKKVTGIKGSDLEGIRSSVGFSFTFKFTYTDMETHETKPLTGEYSYSINSVVKGKILLAEGTYTVDLKHNDTVEIFGLPEGTHYEITENELDRNKYDVEFDNGSGDIVGDKDASVTVNNIYFPEPHKTETKPDNGQNVTVGDQIDYEISWQNPYDRKTTVTVVDNFDKNTDFVSASYGDVELTIDEGHKDGNSYEITQAGIVTITYDPNTHTVTWTIENVESKSSGSVKLSVKVNQGAITNENGTGKVKNGATVKVGNNSQQTEEPENIVVSGGLSVEKIVVGAGGDIAKDFHIVVTLKRDGDVAADINGKYGEMTFNGGVAEFDLIHGESITASELPVGLTYTVEETNGNGYDVTYTNETGSIPTNDTAKAVVTNRKDVTPAKTETDPGDGKEVKIGREITYKITWANNETEERNMTVTDVLDEGLDFVSADNGGTYGDAARTVTWNLGTKAAGTYGVVTLTVKVNEKAVRKGEVENSATVKYGTHSDVVGTPTNPVPSGSLRIEKLVTGTAGDLTEDFTFEIYFYAVGEDGVMTKLKEGYPCDIDRGVDVPVPLAALEPYDKVVHSGDTFTLKHGESFTVTGLPAGVIYEVLERKADGYVTTVESADATFDGSKASGTIEENHEDVVTFYNSKDVPVPETEPEKFETNHDLVSTDNDGNRTYSDVKVGDQIDYRITFENYYAEAADVTITDELDSGVEFLSASYGSVELTADEAHKFEKGYKFDDGNVSITYEADAHTVTWVIKNVPGGESGAVELSVIVTENAVSDHKDKVENDASVKVGNKPKQKTKKVENPVYTGGLSVTKVVVGETSGKDQDKDFEFTVTFILNNKPLENKYTYVKSTLTDESETNSGKIGSGETFTLKDGQSITITGVPEGTEYTVMEINADGYEVKAVGNTEANIVREATAKVTFENRPIQKPHKEETDPGDGMSVGVGDTITYKITWHNDKFENATVTVRDPLDNGLDFVSADNGGVYDAESRTVTWTINAEPESEGTVTLIVKVNKNALDNAYMVDNTAYVRVNNESEQKTETVRNPAAEVDIRKEQSAVDQNGKEVHDRTIEMFSVEEGDKVTYYLTVTATGAEGAVVRNVRVRDAVPEGLKFIDADNGGTLAENGYVYWELGDMRPGESKQVSFRVEIPYRDEATVWTNIAEVTSDNPEDPEDPEYPWEPSNEVKIDEGHGSLSVTKTVTGSAGDKNKNFTFTFRFTDPKGDDIPGSYPYTITRTAPESGISPASEHDDNADGYVSSGGKIALSDGDTVTINELPVGTLYSVTESDNEGYEVDVTGSSGEIKVNDTAVASFINHRDLPHEPEKTEVEPGAGADVAVGQEITYNITWENPYDKESEVVITDPLDKGLDFVSADCEGVKLEKAGEVTENGITVSYTESGEERTVKWTFIAQPNTRGSVTLTVRVNENALTIVENTANVSVDHLPEQRTNPVDNPVVDPDVTIEKFQSVGDDGEITKTPLNVRPGDIVTYYLKVTSTGKTTAKNVTVRDAVPNEPAELTLDEILDGGKLVTPSDPYGFIEWDLGDMEPGEEKTVRFRVLVPKVETATTWVNIGEVTYDHPDEPEDPWEPSNEVEIEEKVGGISVTKTVIGPENDQNTEFNFRIELSDSTISGTYGDLEFTYGIAVFKLKHNETVTVKGLPEGTGYTVSEQAESGFETVFAGEVGTVVNDVVAEVEFTNRRVCDLTVQKMISGDNPDLNAGFTFTVTLDDTLINGQYGDMFFTNGVAAFTLNHGESKTAKGLPYGIGYTVTEAEAEGYTPETNGSTGIIGVGSGAVMFVNIPFTPGSLKISKSVEGFYSGERFEFTVVLTNANGEPLTEAFDIVYSNQDTGTIISGGIIILGNEESAVINGLPFGTHYMITENVNEDYTSAVPVAEGVISGSGEAASVSFVNVRKTGGFSVTKTVSGTGSDPTHRFEFTATLSDTSISGQYGDLTFINGVAVFTLAHGETVTATGLPVGITYTVTENSEDYIPSSSNESGVIGEGRIIAVTFNNHKDIIPVFGGLTVTKTVSGTAGDMTKPFTFTVTLSDKSVNGQYGDMFFINGTATFTLTHGQSATAIDLPAGIGYTVTESDNEGYTVTFIGETGVIPENANAQADFFNNKDIIPTGSLSVTKTVTGHTSPEDFLNYFTFVFTFTDAEGNPLPDPYHYSIGSGTGAEGEIVSGGMIQLRHGETVTVYGLPEGTRYSVSEIGADGYIPNIIGGEGVISSEFGMSATVSAYNDKPTPPVGDITVTKTVSGTAGDYIKQFSFTMTLSDASINGTYGDLTFMNGVAVFTLSHDQSVTASGLPAGIGYSVIENSEDYTVTVDNPSGVIVEGTSVTVNFNNHKDAPPTGGLTVVKTVAGSGADYTRYFSFTVVLSDTSINGQYGGMFFVNGVANFMLRHGESISASGLPAGVTYRVYENDAGDYIVTPSGDSGVIIPDFGAVAEFVNYREEPYVPTGDLTVTKTVTGNAADMTKEFTFTVILSDMSINGQYGDMYFSGGVAFFTLRHGESATASGLPEGISYSVTEADSEGYEVSSSGESGVIVPGARADFVNNKDEDDDEPDEPTGSLTVTKKVTGSGIASQNFTFTVTLSEPLTGQYGDMYFSGGITTFTLRHGQSMSAVGLPDGISYSVTESDNEYYTVTAIGADGVIIGGGSAYCEYINDLSEEDYPKVLEALDMSISPEDVNPPTGHGYVDHIGTAGLLLIFASLFVISKNRKDR